MVLEVVQFLPNQPDRYQKVVRFTMTNLGPLLKVVRVTPYNRTRGAGPALS